MRNRGQLEAIVGLTESPRWATFKDEAEARLEAKEGTINKLIHRTRSPVDPIEIEYFRGFRQGIEYLLEQLPHEAKLELDRLNKAEESDPS